MKLKLRGRPPSPRDYKGRTSNQARFLKAYARVGMIGVAAEMAGISRRSHVKWMHEEPGYPKLFQQAQTQAWYTHLTKVCRRAAATMEAMNRKGRLEFRRAIAARRQKGGRFFKRADGTSSEVWS